jgi:hypothetical protein
MICYDIGEIQIHGMICYDIGEIHGMICYDIGEKKLKSKRRKNADCAAVHGLVRALQLGQQRD